MDNFKKPQIPNRYSSLMSEATQEHLRKSQARSVSASSNISAKSTVSDFLEGKIEALVGELDYIEQYRRGLKETLETQALSKRSYEEEAETIEENETALQKELVSVKRQRKLFEDDLLEKPDTKQLEEAYAASLMQRVLSATAKTPKRRFPTSAFRAAVEDYYGATKLEKDGKKQVFCAVTGWMPSSYAKCPHIVPRILSSEELSHLYGVGELALHDPRNALILQRSIEEALDAGKVVIIPVPGTANLKVSQWRLVLIDQSMSDLTAFGPPVTTWKELDNKDLTFLNENRPARRYLYFRFIMTYMSQKKQGKSMEWADQLDNKGRMWATPDKYLRRSMLQTLARFVSHEFLPEELVDESTFTDVPSCPSRGEEMEELLAMSLAVKIKDAEKDKKDQENDDEDDDDEDDDE